jgi:hypothetical protein
MKKFVRQKSNRQAPNIELDFGAAARKVARVFEPDDYKVRIESARVVSTDTQNVLVFLDLIEVQGGGRIASQPLWVDGPNANAGNLVAENRDLVAQLLTLAKLPTVGNVSELIPKLAGLEFDARLILTIDNRSGRSFNAIADIYADEDHQVS